MQHTARCKLFCHVINHIYAPSDCTTCFTFFRSRTCNLYERNGILGMLYNAKKRHPAQITVMVA